MEFCEGGSLDTIYKRIKLMNGRTGEKVLGKIAESVCFHSLYQATLEFYLHSLSL